MSVGLYVRNFLSNLSGPMPLSYQTSALKLQFGALAATATIVDRSLLGDEAGGDSRFDFQGRMAQRDVEYSPASRTQEMCMSRRVGIKAHIALVNGQLDGRSLLGEQFERVVHRCFGERGHIGQERTVYLVDGGMGVVLHQILHDGQSLHRGLHTVFGQIAEGCSSSHLTIL